MFKKLEGTEALPKPSNNDHIIPLKDSKEPSSLLIYKISETNLVIVKKYINNMLKKGFI